jgi:hypothetical protein
MWLRRDRSDPVKGNLACEGPLTGLPCVLKRSAPKAACMAPSVVDTFHFAPLDAAPDQCRWCLKPRGEHSAEAHCSTPGAHLLALLRGGPRAPPDP